MSAGQAILSGMTVPGAPDLQRLAGVATAAELAAAGMSRGQLRRLVQRGAWLRLAHGVFAPAGLVAAEAGDAAGKHAVRVAAALALTGPGAVASHHSAALIYGMGVFGLPAAEPVTLTRAPGGTSRRASRPGVHLHIAALPTEHVVTWRGLPVTSVPRTVVDVARASPFRAGVVVADSALRARQVSRAELDLCITHCAGWPGIRGARRVAAFADARSESVLESIARVVFHDHGLPPPDLQAWVGDEDNIIGRADFLWRAYRTVGEADGAVKYADPARAMAQLDRDARLRAAGFEVVHFTWQQITRAPGQVVTSIKAAFRRGSAREPGR
jgi:hypothetical protein